MQQTTGMHLYSEILTNLFHVFISKILKQLWVPFFPSDLYCSKLQLQFFNKYMDM